jgi:CheY-like chemotaxis protein
MNATPAMLRALSPRSAHPVNIVIVEDDEGHSRLIEKNLRRSGLTNPLRRFRDGAAALAYLQPPAGPVPDSCMVLLDLNMPGLHGTQVLARLRADDRTANTPVIVLTTTDDPHEIDRCYELGCNFYLTKPVQYDEFVETVRRLGLFLSVVAVPHD